MPLVKGTRLGPYEILGPLGVGGMGEVYEARDGRLDRRVAIKVLPSQLSESVSLRQRFEREARALASLSHPHICTLHDVGREGDVDFLVMEYLEGETLAARLQRGPLPVEQALRTAMEIADALDRAHRQGIVHRDLKPGNVMLTKGGPKLFDFGLARAAANVMATALGPSSAAPTQNLPITASGTILGTLEYMAPEQLEGQEADARADIFALGAIIYEMVTGRRAFTGRSPASLISAILASEPPPLSTLQPLTPPALDRAVTRCLAKDPDERWQSARDLALEMRWIAGGGSAAMERLPPEMARGRRRERVVWVATIAALGTLLGLSLVPREQPSSETSIARFNVPLPEGVQSLLARVSPDGRFLSFTVVADDATQLWLRPLDALTASPMPGTEGARAHFWSPDSRFIGFFAEGKLKKIDITGGSPRALCDAPGAGPFQQGAWSREGTILFSIHEAPGHQEGLYRVAEAGGKPTRLAILDESGEEGQMAWPSFLPDARHFVGVCEVTRSGDATRSRATCIASLDSGKARPLLETTSYTVYSPAGYLLYAQAGSLFAHAFDLDDLRLEGEPYRIVDRVEMWEGIGSPRFSISENGVLLYQVPESRSRLVWRDRRGAEIGQIGPPASYGTMRLSPDGRRLATTMEDGETGLNHIWIVDLVRDVTTRFTPESADAYLPLWSPDGGRIVYCKADDAPPFLHHKPLTGGDEGVLLASGGTMQCPTDWSLDGRLLLYWDRNPTTGADIWVLPLEGERQPIPFSTTRDSEGDAVFAPDGRWVAYVSNESGHSEVYLQPFQGRGEKQRVSRAGGSTPRWRRDGKELFYLSGDGRLMAVPVSLGTNLDVGSPEALFTLGPAPSLASEYDASADGQRFLVNSAIPGTASGPTIVLNWTAQLPMNRPE